ncbi:MAG: 4-(cytidine 5'-diphospho)-2-C-methyl-D-erythritol kinase [bacterium]|nr:4-(cytidine 5'-diphospho)-2-C-methyl-D-erythritol kinase [bacterium]
MNEYSLKTPAKVNLFLQVNGKNSNGYHEIETIFLPLKDIYDTITVIFDDSSDICITTDHPNLPIDETNLCYKAAEQYFNHAGINEGVRINIDKNIPIAAGMGGGSSDAAAALLILQKKFNLLDKKELLALAAKLGADVPFFLNPISSIGRGIGEILKPVEIKRNFYIVVCAPHFPVSAAWAYKNLIKCNTDSNIADCIDSLTKYNVKKISDSLRNDLAPALYKKFPILKILKTALIESGAMNAETTGSGPTLFGICETREQVENIVNKMENKFNADIEYQVTTILDEPFNITNSQVSCKK